jgi:CheY-like chemotaxis protein
MLLLQEDSMPEVCANCVLVVDDDPSIRGLLSRHLENAGFKAIHARDGIDALVKLRDTLPTVIISDLEMPRMSGVEFIGVVRRRFPVIPVVALSGSIPCEFSEDIKPDCWFEKSMLGFPELLQTVGYLARKTPNHVDLPQVISLPIRARPGGGDYVVLTCPDCLRTFRAESTPGNKPVERTAACTYCKAGVPFLIESAESE